MRDWMRRWRSGLVRRERKLPPRSDGRTVSLRASPRIVNSVTQYVDSHRHARSVDHRRDAAWFGQGAQIKQRVWAEAMALLG
jgi:hypothetical protein